MGKDIELAILFADVVGSTRLYEQMGDLRARDMVAICIDVMRSATEQRQGPGNRHQDHGGRGHGYLPQC
jgi:adenylate cyclase